MSEYALVRGVRQTRGALARWNRDPWPVLGSWIGGAASVAIGAAGGRLADLVAWPGRT